MTAQPRHIQESPAWPVAAFQRSGQLGRGYTPRPLPAVATLTGLSHAAELAAAAP